MGPHRDRGCTDRLRVGTASAALLGVVLTGCSSGGAEATLCKEMSDLAEVVERYYAAGRSEEAFERLIDEFDRAADRISQKADRWDASEMRAETLAFAQGMRRFADDARAGSYWQAVGSFFAMDAALRPLAGRCEVVPYLSDI